MSITRKVKYRADLFSNLVSEEHVLNAINEFGAVLNSNNYHLVLEDILSQPSILELVLSNISSEIPLSEWMVANFPSNANSFFDSLSSKVLERLSKFFCLRSPQTIQPSGFANESAKFLSQTPDVFRALFAMVFVEEMGPPTTLSRPQLSTKTKANSQRYQKKLKKLSANVQHEDTLLKANITIPYTRSEAMEIVESILTKLRDIYEKYLSGIRYPEISKSIRESCITVNVPFPLTVITNSAPNRQVDYTPMAPTNETAPAPLLHLKLSHYCDTPDGFGEWNILLSSRADRALRDYHRTNPMMYEIIRRKINDLSNGHFSYDNQKRLNGPKTDIPIYEAKMTGDLRLVYVVDCITSPTDNQREMQALKVFDFCTHAKMDHRLWDSVAGYFQSQDKEYRSRCLKRQRRAGDNGDVYVPVSFPAREEGQEGNSEGSSFLADLVPQDSNELHSLITLEKYVALSKDLLESIEADREGAFPFVLSRYEKKIAEYPRSCYVLGRSGTGKTTTMLHKMLWVQRAYQLHTADTQCPRQIFVTRSSVLARKVEEHFSTYIVAGRMDESRTRLTESTSDDLVNQNSYSAWRESKRTFKGLTDVDFPLFIPLEDLYYLLEGDIDWNGKPSIALGARFRPLAEYKGRSISFHRFLGEYWPTFSKRLTNLMDPALVFNEIIGVISGSEKTLGSEEGHLAKEQYLESSRAAGSNFTPEQRGIIYDIFVLYLKLKHQLDDYDISDRSRTIIAALKHGALTVRRIDHLYVDETQDNLLIDALVLRLLCRNPDGLFWAGDTAQTISAGSAFRFDDLKAFMYRIEKQRLKQETKSCLVKPVSPVPPHVFQLATNFRSHAGIVDCAHIVVELIKKYFPHTIDVLKRERGVVEGAKPMFCSEFDPQQFKEGGILSSSNMNGDRIELGAQQCILVRDDAAKERFLEEIGNIGLVVTLYDSKGLEFNDVILLNFFEDSNLTRDQWSVVLNMAPGRPYAPKFDLIKHSAICLELKSLYVAITRTRNNLRIVDCSDKSEPMKTLWEKLGCVTQATFQEAFKNFAVQSSREDWIKRAKESFDQEKYALSSDAYLRGQSYRHAAVAAAYYERECAERTPAQVNRNKAANPRSEKYNKAAEAFVRCANEAEGEEGRKKYYQIVAECYEKADIFLKAVEYYRLAGDFTSAAILLRKLGLFDEVKDIVTKHGKDIKPEVLENLKDVARLYFVSSKDYSKVHELFDTPEDELEYLEDRNLDLAQVDLHLHHGRITEAADVHIADGRFHEAASLLISDRDGGRASLMAAANAIIQGLKTCVTFGINSRSNPNADQLLALSGSIPLEIWTLDERHRDEIIMFKSLCNNHVDRLYKIVDGLLAHNNVPAALLVLDYIFTTPPAIAELLEVVKVVRILTYFSQYAILLHDTALFADPTDGNYQKLFGVVQHDSDTFSLRPGSFLAAFKASNAEYSRMAGTMKKIDLVALFRRSLQERLKQKVAEELFSYHSSSVFDPCLRHVALGDCDRTATHCHRPHITTDENWFHDWIRIHLLQIFIYDTVRRLEMPKEVMRQQVFWLKKLHEAINPPHHAMGSLSRLTRELVHDMARQLLTVQNWIREITATLDIHPDHSFLTTAILSTDLAFIFDRKEASRYIYRSRFVQPDVIDPKFLRLPTMENSLKELLLAFQGKGTDSLLMGVYFIRHIVERGIKVDINVLCTFIERICGLLVVYNTFVYHLSFHNIMLPLSWLKRIVNEFDYGDAKAKKKNCFYLILRPLDTLIQRLYFGGNQSNHLLFGSKYASIPNGIRKIYISRICRVLGLLGQNIQVFQFRQNILQIFKSLLSSEHRGFPGLYSRYIYSNTFEDVLKATRRSMMESPLDEMVMLKDLQKMDGHQAPVLGVRRIMYYTEEDLATSLGLSGLPVGLDSFDSTLDAQVDIPQGYDHDEIQGEDDAPGITSVDADFEPATHMPDDFYVTHSEEEILNACKIQRICRRIQGHKKLRESSSLEGRAYQYFEACLCLLEEEKMHRVRCTRQYRWRYLAAVPYLLACINIIYDHLYAAKVKAKQQLTRLKHEALEELSERYTLLNGNIKAVNKFRGMFGVGSALHQRSDVEELRIQVQLLQDVLRNRKFPVTIMGDVSESLALVYRVVFKRPSKPTAKTPKRPQLAVDGQKDLTHEAVVGSWEDDVDEQ